MTQKDTLAAENTRSDTSPTVRRIIGPTILLSNGDYFDFDAPAFGLGIVDVIAHSLSNLCRFTGHCQNFYSVAEHSVHVSRIVPPEMAMIGLLHDASEAFCGDLAKPFKVMLPDYKRIEDRVEAALFAHLKIPLPFPPEIKSADRTMLAVEQVQAMGNSDTWYHTHGQSPADVRLEFWSPRVARIEFMNRYRELSASATDEVTP